MHVEPSPRDEVLRFPGVEITKIPGRTTVRPGECGEKQYWRLASFWRLVSRRFGTRQIHGGGVGREIDNGADEDGPEAQQRKPANLNHRCASFAQIGNCDEAIDVPSACVLL